MSHAGLYQRQHPRYAHTSIFLVNFYFCLIAYFSKFNSNTPLFLLKIPFCQAPTLAVWRDCHMGKIRELQEPPVC